MNGIRILMQSGAPMVLCTVYIILINIISFILMGADKKKAEKGAVRIPEADLFLSAALGGAIGGMLGMTVFRHKTKHTAFLIGFPCILAFHLLVLILCIRWLGW